jgi:Bacterial Ig domain
MQRSAVSSRVRGRAHARRAAVFLAGLVLFAGAAAQAAQPAGSPPPLRGAWPSLQDQLDKDHVIPGSALEKLISENQEFGMLRPEEATDSRGIPLWLRVLYRKNHPTDQFSGKDPTGGYPLVLGEVHEWMLTHQDLVPGPGMHGPHNGAVTLSASESGEERISGAQTSPRSESMIRMNRNNTQQIIGASNNISSSGQQAQFFSSNGGSTWGQTTLSLHSGDAFMSDPAVDWTSDGTAWSTTIGIDSTQTVLRMEAYKSTNGGATWTFDNVFSASLTNNDKEQMWVDHSATSAFKDNIYVIWHPGNPAVVARRTGPTGSWQTPVQVSGSETTGTAIGGDIKTNANGDVFGFYPDTGSRGLYVVKSTNGGASFSAPTRIATSFGSFQFAIPADASRQCLIYMTGGAYRNGTTNNVYVAWDDLSGDAGCTSGGGPGTNASSTCKSRIFFSRSTDGGATWSAPVKINNQSGLNDQFFPWLVVDDSSGKVSITYYDTVGDSTRTSTNYYYQSSTDNGQTWSAPFKVTTASTNETTAGADSGNQYGDYTGLDGINGTFFPSWTDRRSGASEEIWSAAILDSTSTPDFTISASPSSASIAQGGSANVTVSTTVSNGFNNAVALSASGQPSGVTVSFNPTSIPAPGSGSSTMTIAVGSSVPTGTSTITITGTGGSTTHTTTVVLTVTTSGFSISASPTSTTIVQGSSGNVTISTTVSGTFNSAVALSASGQPSGVTVSFNPTSIPAPGSGSSTMTITVASSAATGSSTITVTGTGGSITHTATVALTVTAPGSNPVVNGGFETGNFSGWTTSGAATSVIAGAAHSGSFGAQLGATTATNGDSSIAQTFTMPSSSPSLSFWYNNHCPDTLTYDWATATLKDNVTGTTTTLLAKTCNNPGGTWTQVNYNASANAGHSVTLTLTSHDDNFGADPTYTWYDDVVVTSGPPDTTPPTTSITAPANGATVSGTVTITASASDNVGVTKVEIYIDSALATTLTTSPYNFSWNTTTVANGSHSIFSKAYDAAGNVGTSATITVTVSNSTAQQLLGNPGFENGTSTAPWTLSAGVINNSSSEPPHSGSWDAWLDGYGTTHTDTALQQVTIPSTITTATLSFWLHIDTAETTTTTAFDTLQVQIRNSSGTVLATLATFSNLNHNTGYAQHSYDVSAYKGQTIQVFLTGSEDASLQTSFVLDDFALNVQ